MHSGKDATLGICWNKKQKRVVGPDWTCAICGFAQNQASYKKCFTCSSPPPGRLSHQDEATAAGPDSVFGSATRHAQPSKYELPVPGSQRPRGPAALVPPPNRLNAPSHRPYDRAPYRRHLDLRLAAGTLSGKGDIAPAGTIRAALWTAAGGDREDDGSLFRRTGAGGAAAFGHSEHREKTDAERVAIARQAQSERTPVSAPSSVSGGGGGGGGGGGEGAAAAAAAGGSPQNRRRRAAAATEKDDNAAGAADQRAARQHAIDLAAGVHELGLAPISGSALRPLTPYNQLLEAAITSLALPPAVGHASFLEESKGQADARNTVTRWVRHNVQPEWQRQGQRERVELEAAKAARAQRKADAAAAKAAAHALKNELLGVAPAAAAAALLELGSGKADAAALQRRVAAWEGEHGEWDAATTEFGRLSTPERLRRRAWRDAAAELLCRAAMDGDVAGLRKLLAGVHAEHASDAHAHADSGVGLDVDAPWRGGTALWYAWTHWQAVCARELLLAGANPRRQMVGVAKGKDVVGNGMRIPVVKARDCVAELKAHPAAEARHEMHRFWLVMRGVFRGVSLHRAARDGDAAYVEFLLRDCMVQPQLQNPRGMTALHFAAGEGHLSVAAAILRLAAWQAALAKGVDAKPGGGRADGRLPKLVRRRVLNATNGKGQTPLDCCDAHAANAPDALKQACARVAAFLRAHGGDNGVDEADSSSSGGAGPLTAGHVQSMWRGNGAHEAYGDMLAKGTLHSQMLAKGSLAKYAKGKGSAQEMLSPDKLRQEIAQKQRSAQRIAEPHKSTTRALLAKRKHDAQKRKAPKPAFPSMHSS
jgi:hypothetical protein